MATSPRSSRSSSICVTFLAFVQPVDAQGTTHVSGISREASGPEPPSTSRMSRRKRSLSRSHTRVRSYDGNSAASARWRPRSLIGRISASNSNSFRSSSACRSWAGR